MSVTKEPRGDRSERESAGTDRKGADYIGWPIRNPRETRERVGYFVLHFGSSLVSLLSLGVNLLGHNGNSQDGRMKVLIPRLLRLTVGSGSFHLPFTYRSPAEPAPAGRSEREREGP